MGIIKSERHFRTSEYNTLYMKCDKCDADEWEDELTWNSQCCKCKGIFCNRHLIRDVRLSAGWDPYASQSAISHQYENYCKPCLIKMIQDLPE